MILEFTIKNYRSFKKEVKLSLIPESSQSKEDNVFTITYGYGATERLLKSAVIYGANASGKSNVIRAVYQVVDFITNSADIKAGEPLNNFQPFLFDEDSITEAISFSITFVMARPSGLVKFKYFLDLTVAGIVREELEYYPKGQGNTLFKRNVDPGNKDVVQSVKVGKDLNYKTYDILRNQLLLSKFGNAFPNELMTSVYLYFNSVQVWNATNRVMVDLKKVRMAEDLILPENAHRLKRMNKLMQIADTRIESLSIKLASEKDFKFPEGFPEDVKNEIIADNKTRITAYHKVFKNQKPTRVDGLPFEQESEGTNVLFALGGIILKALETGGTLFFDELDNSLHPKLSRFLIRLFNNVKANPLNAQLIFATHEVTLLDKDIFRKDQIWITQRDKYGISELYSIKEFREVREDTPFDKWYLTGKFGGNPKIKEIEFIFDNG